MSSSYKSALIVEDDMIAGKYLSLLLRIANFDVTIVENAARALETVAAKNFDMLFVDIILGVGPDGIELYRELKKMNRFQNVPAISISARAEELADEIRSVGFTDYIQKPFNQNQLVEVLRKYPLATKNGLDLP